MKILRRYGPYQVVQQTKRENGIAWDEHQVRRGRKIVQVCHTLPSALFAFWPNMELVLSRWGAMNLEPRCRQRRTVLDDLAYLGFIAVLTWFVLMLITSFFI